MAETILSVVAEEIIGKLISVTTEQISLAWGFKEELTKLRDSLTTIQAVLADAERRQGSEEFVKLWLRRLKDVAYDADYVLGELDYEILRRKVEIRNQMKRKVCFFFSFSNPIAFRLKMANKIKSIHESLKEINDKANSYGFARASPVNANLEIIPNRETDSSLDHSEVVGRGDHVSKIVDLLTGATKEQLYVVSIVGMAGMGKTTLAKQVYNDERVKRHFDRTIWALSIYNLEHVRDKEEAKSAKLSEKKGVNKLGFHWNSEREGTINDEDVLEGLQPHPCLKSLKIENFQGEKFPSWILARNNSSGGMLLLDHLLEIFLENCNKCEKIPTLGHLSHLKVLKIKGMNNVTCMGTEFYGNYSGEGSSNSRGDNGRNAMFPSLEKLVLEDMPNLVEWKDAMEPTITTAGMVFPSLKELEIKKCGQLISAPCHFPALKQLMIDNTKSIAFKNICSNLTTLTNLSIGGVSELSCLPEQLLQNNASLMDLRIRRCADLESISPHEDVWAFCTSLRSIQLDHCEKLSYLADTLRTLQSLEKLVVFECPNLRSFPSIQGVASLQSLAIFSCPNLISIPDIGECLKTLTIGGFFEELDAFPSLNPIQHLRASLEKLDLYGWDKLNSLPDEIKYFTALKSLCISGFDGMKALPEWLGNLSSLQILDLNDNKNLMEMPTVQAISISGCPELKERCAKGSGTEWSKIAHIPRTTNGIISGNFMEFQIHSQANVRWRKNQLKLAEVHNCWVNFVGAVFEEIQKIGVGVVVWDEHRLFIGALSSLEDMGTDAEEAEVMAVMEISFSQVSRTGNGVAHMLVIIDFPIGGVPQLRMVQDCPCSKYVDKLLALDTIYLLFLAGGIIDYNQKLTESV
uniref:Uncharacterized protein n=1 Tax=Quercus lobata TaxID=97700 RepID=A0A7N2M5C6_QUELO